MPGFTSLLINKHLEYGSDFQWDLQKTYKRPIAWLLTLTDSVDQY